MTCCVVPESEPKLAWLHRATHEPSAAAAAAAVLRPGTDQTARLLHHELSLTLQLRILQSVPCLHHLLVMISGTSSLFACIPLLVLRQHSSPLVCPLAGQSPAGGLGA